MFDLFKIGKESRLANKSFLGKNITAYSAPSLFKQSGNPSIQQHVKYSVVYYDQNTRLLLITEVKQIIFNPTSPRKELVLILASSHSLLSDLFRRISPIIVANAGVDSTLCWHRCLNLIICVYVSIISKQSLRTSKKILTVGDKNF